MPTLTNLTGSLYDSQGNVLLAGKLYVSLPQDMISVDGTKVAPTMTTVDLSSTSGVVNISVFATVGASPAGLSYKVEFDPDPTDLTKPMKQKDGYFFNYWSVPNTASLDIGSFTSALRGAPSANYIPVSSLAGSAGALVGYVVVIINGAPQKIAYYAI